MEVNVHHAKTHLSKLISAVESGEEVAIERNGKPAVKLVVVEPVSRARKEVTQEHPRQRLGKIWIIPDLDSPET